jgi:hypothetical protein
LDLACVAAFEVQRMPLVVLPAAWFENVVDVNPRLADEFTLFVIVEQ